MSFRAWAAFILRREAARPKGRNGGWRVQEGKELWRSQSLGTPRGGSLGRTRAGYNEET